ncbi:MAG: hypothetical protein WD851_24855 [Pirellulales bacterium]
MSLTSEQIRQQGLEALRRELGATGMIRFLQQFEHGSGDYSRDRHAWVDANSLEDLQRELLASRNESSDDATQSHTSTQ